jgi:hypothetical protein
MKYSKQPARFLLGLFILLAAVIVFYVLFTYPYPGVADQGDFDRVMSVSGLSVRPEDSSNPNFKRFFDYLVTDYSITRFGILRPLAMLVSTSMTYFINLIVLLCSMLGKNIFKTEYMAVLYAVLYISGGFLLLKYIDIKSKAVYIFTLLLGLFIFFDGNYLIWFNSLYGEPMMITTLTLFIAAWFYYIHTRNGDCSNKSLFLSILYILITAYLFLGSKLQVITSLPIIVFLVMRVLLESKALLNRKQLIGLSFISVLVILYPIVINIGINTFSGIGKDTMYNSVFYGVLKDSKTPRQDLIDMGLNPDMAVEAGKHSYLDKKEYVKYIPHSELTEKEFYSKMGNSKLVKFYLTHPVRFVKGMEYTADHAFSTSTYLGKYKMTYSKEPVREFTRFTGWSYFKEHYLPKSFLFIVLVYALMLVISIAAYINSNCSAKRERILILWSIMLIGMLQYPMSFVGNGYADTTKQLYLFNFIFDIMLLVSTVWCFQAIQRKLFKHR